jgi:iron-sulfur cluster insertion protein
MENMVHLSESAAKRVKTLQGQQAKPDLMLRVQVDGGGCAGFQYIFDFAEAPKDDDKIFEEHGVKMLVDEVSLGFLQGSTIDYIESLIGAAFQVKNPNASSSCGCGTSFSV